MSGHRDGAAMRTDPPVLPGVDPAVPSPARRYDYLGGTADYPSDRMAADRLRELIPELEDTAWANRAFHQRAARWTAEQEIRQFIDMGSGLPTEGNTHEVVLAQAPDARVVYVDHDPMVPAYSKELLADAAGATLIQADLRDPEEVLDQPKAVQVGEWGQMIPRMPTATVSSGVTAGVARCP